MLLKNFSRLSQIRPTNSKIQGISILVIRRRYDGKFLPVPEVSPTAEVLLCVFFHLSSKSQHMSGTVAFPVCHWVKGYAKELLMATPTISSGFWHFLFMVHSCSHLLPLPAWWGMQHGRDLASASCKSEFML